MRYPPDAATNQWHGKCIIQSDSTQVTIIEYNQCECRTLSMQTDILNAESLVLGHLLSSQKGSAMSWTGAAVTHEFLDLLDTLLQRLLPFSDLFSRRSGLGGRTILRCGSTSRSGAVERTFVSATARDDKRLAHTKPKPSMSPASYRTRHPTLPCSSPKHTRHPWPPRPSTADD